MAVVLVADATPELARGTAPMTEPLEVGNASPAPAPSSTMPGTIPA
jgi:hypothetical protein